MIRMIVMFFGLALAIDSMAGPPYPMEARRVAPNVYAVITPVRELPNPQNRGWNSNSAFVITGAGVLVFDTGSSADIGRALKQTIAGITEQPVRWIINSHAHGDHWLGNAAFDDTVATIYASPTVQERIRLDGETWVKRFNKMTDGATGHSRIVPPTESIAQRTELVLGQTRVVVFPSDDSHSPGDLLAWLPASKVLLSGDVVYSDRMPSTNNANLRHWMDVLRQLEKLDPAVVIPGHGDITDVAGIVRLRNLFETLWAAVEQGVEAGKAPYEVVPDVREALAGFREAYPGMEAKLKRDIPRVYLQVEAASF